MHTTTRRPFRPRAGALRLGGLAAAVVAVLGASAIVWQASYASYSATTVNPGNSWSAGTVVLADDDASGAMFSVSNMKPGDTGTRCIAVTSTGSLPSAVKLYGTGYSTTNALGSSMNLVVTLGTGSTYAASPACTGFTADGTNPSVYSGTLDNFATTSTNYGNGVGVWAPAGGTVTRVYRFVWTLNSGAANSTAGGTAAIGFTWEAQNS